MLNPLSSALAQYELKDSYYFMKDDGIFSDEEKDEEAEYIREECLKTTLQQRYYDCSCLAGAFRIRRDEEKLVPQDQILSDLYSDRNTKCVDTAKIAGNTYYACQEYAAIFRNRKAENNEYCKCVSNTVANEFAKSPRMKSYFINNLRVQAMSSCNAKYNKPLR